jgi:putative transposase
MARMARVMFEGAPFHITHRGNHKKIVFNDDRDRGLYLSLVRRYAARFEMSVWGYCLMSNHVHLLAMGKSSESIPRALGNAHREYSRLKNQKTKVTGHLWANRFFSTVLDEPHLWAAIRYVELNPVRAGIVGDATTFGWSSARAHAGLAEDELLAADRPFPGPINDWRQWLANGLEEGTLERIRENTARGSPTGSERFVTAIERRLNRRVRPRRRRWGTIPVP